MLNPYSIVNEFEQTIAEYAGSKYAVAVDSCCNAIFLSCLYKRIRGKHIAIPHKTYPGVACAIIHAGGKLIFSKVNWNGIYNLSPVNIIDGALRFRQGMYKPRSFHCLSFHIKKHLPIGRGGMILTDDVNAYHWLKKARFDGRDEVPLNEDNIRMVGWNMYMTPEQATRGLMLFNTIKDRFLPDIDSKVQGYPDLSKIREYR